MEKILLVQQYQGRKEPKGALFPLGLCYIATPLAERYEVAVLDLNLHDEPYPVLEKKLFDFEPDVIGISLRNIDSLDKRNPYYYYQTIPEIMTIIKSISPAAKTVIGGSGFSIFAEAVMEKNPGIDFAVYLEGEESFPELIENIESPEKVQGIFYRRGGQVNFTGARPLPDFSSMASPRRDLCEINSYGFHLDNIGVQTKRGCVLNCVYCSYPFLNGNRLRLRTPEHVVDEIENLVEAFGIREFMFVDGVFNSPLKHAIAICEEIIRRKLPVKWKAWCDIKNFTEEFFELAQKAGCVSLPFSPDGVTDASLQALGKGIKAADINRTIRILRKHKHVHASFGFFCTSPQQTYWGILKTVYYYLLINVLFLGRGGATLAWIRIEPHTDIHAIALSEGVISQETDLLPDEKSGLKDLFYCAPGMKAGDWFAESVVWLINKAVKPLLGIRRGPR